MSFMDDSRSINEIGENILRRMFQIETPALKYDEEQLMAIPRPWKTI
jgi:hypothetical protein